MIWLWIGLGVAAVVVLIFVVRMLKNRGKGKMTALALFLREPRVIDAQAVRRAATKVFGVRIGSTTEEENFVVQISPEMMPVRINGLPLGFICTTKPYMDPKPPPEALKGMDARLAQAILDHKAWISLDLIGDVPAAMKPEVYRHIARILAEFVDDNCLAIYCPENDEMMFNHPGLKQALRGENPLAALEMKDVPIVQASYDDPELKATVDEAQKRWPEFAAAFAKRKPGQTFGVKLKFVDGEDEEFMWAMVESIQGDTIRGTLDNSPAQVKNIKSGDTVTAARKDVLDWMYDEGEEMRGGFSLKALSGQ